MATKSLVHQEINLRGKMIQSTCCQNMEQAMLTLPEHLMSFSVFLRARIVQALVVSGVFLSVSMFVLVSSFLPLILSSSLTLWRVVLCL